MYCMCYSCYRVGSFHQSKDLAEDFLHQTQVRETSNQLFSIADNQPDVKAYYQ